MTIMKKIILFEGIASSGKTTLEKLLANEKKNSKILSEGETLMPIIDNKTEDVARTHLQKQIEAITNASEEYVIVDRFHLTHAFRTQSQLATFSEIESQLQEAGSVLLVLLTINPERIRERIEETIERRKDGWKKGAQGTIDEKVAYYQKQQEILKTLLSESHLPTMVMNTTKKEWEVYVREILEKIG